MASTIIEAPDDSAQSNVEVTTDTNVTATPETQKVEEKPVVESEETQQQAQTDETVELEGKKYTASQIKKWEQEYENDSKWRTKNQEESARLNREAEELAQLRALKPLLEQRKDVLQQLFQPQQQRDFDAELNQLIQNEPDPSIYPVEHRQWQYQKELLASDRTAYIVQQQTEQKFMSQKATEENQRVIDYGKQRYLDSNLVGSHEFVNMTNWIDQNFKTRNGIVPKEAYDVAFRTLYEDKYLSKVKLEATKKAVAPLLKTTNSQDNGTTKPRVAKTDKDIKDDAFVSAMSERQKG